MAPGVHLAICIVLPLSSCLRTFSELLLPEMSEESQSKICGLTKVEHRLHFLGVWYLGTRAPHILRKFGQQHWSDPLGRGQNVGSKIIIQH